MIDNTEYVTYKTSDIEKLLTGLNSLTITGINNSKIIVGVLNILENPVPKDPNPKRSLKDGESNGTN